MRITGGTARGRKLVTPKGGDLIRPTSDRVREAIFNILGGRLAGSRVIDFFAGTGALGIEALSRGADSVVFVDQSKEAGRLIHTNITNCFTQPKALFFQIRLPSKDLQAKLAPKLGPHPLFDLVFMDPPYNRNLVIPMLQMVEQAKILAPNGLIIVEEHRNTELPHTPDNLQLKDNRRYGETGVWVYAEAANTIENDND